MARCERPILFGLHATKIIHTHLAVAQWIKRQLLTPEVCSSTPDTSIIYMNNFLKE